MNFNIEPRISSHPTITSKYAYASLNPSNPRRANFGTSLKSTSQLTYKTTTSPLKCLPTFLIQHATFLLLLLRSSNKTLEIPDQFSCVTKFVFGRLWFDMFLLLLSTAAVVVARRGRRRRRRHRSRDYNNDYNHSTLASGRIERRARYMVGEFLQWENRGVEEMIFCAIFPTQGST